MRVAVEGFGNPQTHVPQAVLKSQGSGREERRPRGRSTWGARPEVLGEGGTPLLRPTVLRDPDPVPRGRVLCALPGLEVRAGPKLPVFP